MLASALPIGAQCGGLCVGKSGKNGTRKHEGTLGISLSSPSVPPHFPLISPPFPNALSKEHFRSDRIFLGCQLMTGFGCRVKWVPDVSDEHSRSNRCFFFFEEFLVHWTQRWGGGVPQSRVGGLIVDVSTKASHACPCVGVEIRSPTCGGRSEKGCRKPSATAVGCRGSCWGWGWGAGGALTTPQSPLCSRHKAVHHAPSVSHGAWGSGVCAFSDVPRTADSQVTYASVASACVPTAARQRQIHWCPGTGHQQVPIFGDRKVLTADCGH